MKKSGLSLVEVIIAIGLISLLFGGIYASYVSIIDVVTNSGVRTEAASLVANQIEIIRNLPYDQVGTVGGVPSGILPQSQTVTSTSGMTFLIRTYVRNIDDPFDGTLGGAPNDTSPNDYKTVELSVQCTSCAKSIPLIMTTTVAPKNLESAASDGSLFISVLDSSGHPVPTATVQIVNASVTPSINLTDTTNASGVLQLIGTPTSTQGYAITVSKAGYSTERTYAIGSLENPNPLSQYTNATVVAQTVSSKTFLIDKLSTTTFKAIGPTCQSVGAASLSIAGQKLIGTNIIKFSTTTQIDSTGQKIFGGMEWDIYSATSTSSSYDLLGTMPLIPFTLNPNTNLNFYFVFASTSPNSLLVSTIDSSGNAISNSTVTISKFGFSDTKESDRAYLSETNWSNGNFQSQDGGVDVDTVPGTIRMMSGPDGYSTTTTSWLISNTIDIGSSTGSFYTLDWNPSSQLSGATLQFQIASNNDNATWNFEGPDGTVGTYYSSPGQTISSDHANHRYIRYKVFLSTNDSAITPTLSNIQIQFDGVCVPSGQVLFQGLTSGTYSVTADAPGHTTASGTVSVSSGSQGITLILP